MMNNKGNVYRIINFIKRTLFKNNQRLSNEGQVEQAQEKEIEVKQSNAFKQQIEISKDSNR